MNEEIMEYNPSGALDKLTGTVNFETENAFLRLGNEKRTFQYGDCRKSNFRLDPVLLNDYSLKNNQIIFNLQSKNWIDPYSIKFEFLLRNLSSDMLQLDSSIHSMISDLTIRLNDVVIESYPEYPRLKKFEHDIKLSRYERVKRREDEGFAFDQWGNRELILWPTNEKSGGFDNYFKNEKLLLDVARKEMQFQDVYNGSVENLKNEFLKSTKKSSKSSEFTSLDHVHEGKIEDKPKVSDGGYVGRDKMFKVPLESRLFGAGIEVKNWKLMTYRNFKLTIIYTLNADFVFCPNEKSTRSKQDGIVKLLKPTLTYTEYSFTEEFDAKIYENFKTHGFSYDYLKLNIESKVAFNNFPNTFSLRLKSTDYIAGVRALYFVCYDTASNLSFMVRPMAYFNSGYSKMSIVTDNGPWPNENFYDNRSALYTGGNVSVKECLNDIYELNMRSNKYGALCLTKYNLAAQLDNSVVAAIFASKNDKDKASIEVYKKKVVKILGEDKFLNKLICGSTSSSIDLCSEEFLKYYKEWLESENSYAQVFPRCAAFLTLKFDTVPYSSDKTISGLDLSSSKMREIFLSKSEEDLQAKGEDLMPDLAGNTYKIGVVYSETYVRQILTVDGTLYQVPIDTN